MLCVGLDAEGLPYGLKVTGDPNVPAGQLCFRAIGPMEPADPPGASAPAGGPCPNGLCRGHRTVWDKDLPAVGKQRPKQRAYNDASRQFPLDD